jgi:hypothetical protein
MTHIFDVLNVTGCAIGFVGRDQHAVCAWFQPAIMTSAASSPWRLSIDRVECFVAA